MVAPQNVVVGLLEDLSMNWERRLPSPGVVRRGLPIYLPGEVGCEVAVPARLGLAGLPAEGIKPGGLRLVGRSRRESPHRQCPLLRAEGCWQL